MDKQDLDPKEAMTQYVADLEALSISDAKTIDLLRERLAALVSDDDAGWGINDHCVYCSDTFPEHAPDCPIALGRLALKGAGDETK